MHYRSTEGAAPKLDAPDTHPLLNGDAVRGHFPPARRTDSTDCICHDVENMLQSAGLRPTRQRLALAQLVFGNGDRHITAEMLYEEAMLAGILISLATVYNTLNQFTSSGLLRQVAVDGSKSYFDTNIAAHHHFYLENSHDLVDIPASDLFFSKLPDVPDNYEISRIDVVVRLRKKRETR